VDYIHFFLKNKNVIFTGFTLAFFSSFGQTFFLSLYVPGIIDDTGISNSSFGAIYGSATILSSITLAYAGKFIDTRDLRSYTMLSALLLAASCLVMAFSFNLILIFAGFWGLRLAGQGLMTHIQSTAISKIFSSTRGKALSLTSLGYPAGEAIFPLATGSIILILGWRYSMMINAVFIISVLIPLILINMKSSRFQDIRSIGNNNDSQEDFSRFTILRDSNFYIIAISSFVLPFVITGLFFYQISLSSEKGWPVTLLPACFIGYAGARAIFSLASGKLIDKFSAAEIFPFYLIPFAAGLLILAFFSHPFAAFTYLFLSGVSVGLSSTVKTALLAEIYGTDNLGSIRSFFATLMVLSTAVSPALFGWLLDRGATLSLISGVSLTAVIFTIIISFRININCNVYIERGSEA
jgi:MFS family permease